MTEAMFDLIWILESFCMPLLLFRFLSAMFIPRKDSRWFKCGLLFACMLVIWYLNSFRNPTLNLCGGLAALTLEAVWLFRLRIRHALLYVTFFMILMVNVEMVVVFLRPPLGLSSEPSIISILIVTAEIFTKIFLIEMARKQVRTKDTEREHSYMGFLSLFSAAVFILLMSGIYPEAEAHRENLFMVLSSVLFILGNIVGFTMEEKMMEAAGYQQKNRLMAQKAELERLHYRRMEELTQEYGTYVHELEHSLRTLRQLWKNDRYEAAQQLAATQESLGRCFQKKLYLSDPIVNAILTETERTCREKALCYNVTVSPGLSLDFIQDIDKISMFGNLLDNAVEAADRTGHGFVKVSLYMGNNALLVFRVENSCTKVSREKNGHYLTTKQDWRNHGFGIKKVKELAQKYNGFLDIQQRENVFDVSLVVSTLQKSVN